MNTARAPERRQLTVMLCDLVGWTSLSVKLDVEELANVAGAYRQRCKTIVEAHGGTVAQYAGDAVVAYFGYPQAHENDAERAVRASLAIVGASGSSLPEACSNVHIGIATGIVVVGDLEGTVSPPHPDTGHLPVAKQISAVGSAPNLAARLQALAPAGTVVISDQTRRLAGGIFEYEDLGRRSVKGFEDPVRAWRVVAEGRVKSRFHALRASALTPLVNRQTELAALRDAWSSVRAGLGRAVLLSGEPGIGKSRLAQVTAEIVGPRCLHLWYYCSPHLQSSPLGLPVHQLASAAGFAVDDDNDEKLRKLAAIVPPGVEDPSETVALLASLLSLDYTGQYPRLYMSPQRQKRRLFRAVMHILERLAARRPVLVVMEDLHWIDPSTEELLDVLIHRLTRIPALAVLTTRPEFDPQWNHYAHVASISLEPLKRSDSVTMIELLCGKGSVSSETIERIADQTDGIPLFIEDLARDAVELGALHETESSVSASRDGSILAIPATLNDSLMARLDRLGSAKRVAQLAAAIGREFSFALLAAVARLPERELDGQLNGLLESGLLIAPRSTLQRTYSFKHALVRDAAYASLLRKDRAALHLTIAELLEEAFPEIADGQPEVVAHHFEAAKDIDRAALYLIRAAELSAKRSGFVEAAAQLRRALDLLSELPESTARLRRELQAYVTLGEINAEYRGLSAAECDDAYRKALQRCRLLENAPEIFPVLSGLGSLNILRAAYAESRALAEECLTLAASQTTTPPFVMGHRLLGGTLFMTGELSAARVHLEKALSYYEQDTSPYARLRVVHVQDYKTSALCYLALTLTMLGYLDRGLEAARNGLNHSRLLGDPHVINYSLCYLAAVHHFRRDSRATLRCATESLQLAREQGFATWIGISQMIAGEAMVNTGNAQAGLAEIGSGMQAHKRMEATAYQPFGISLLAKGLLGANRCDEALDASSQALNIVEKTGERFYLAELWRLKGEILAQARRLAEAEAALEQAIDVARQQNARLFELRSVVTLCSLLDEPRRGRVMRDALQPLYAWFAEGADTADLRDARMLLGRTAR
jgi:class 3 adenylate cyclase/tetratricopeptide (TPR) repeat protein